MIDSLRIFRPHGLSLIRKAVSQISRGLCISALCLATASAQDIHADLVPETPKPKPDAFQLLMEPTITNPELFYREAWERTARIVADPDSDSWFTVILADFPGPDGDFKSQDWLATHAAEKLAAGLYVFPAEDGGVKLGGGLFRRVADAIRLSRSRQVKHLAGSRSPLIQQLGTMARDLVQPAFPEILEADSAENPELEPDSPENEEQTIAGASGEATEPGSPPAETATNAGTITPADETDTAHQDIAADTTDTAVADTTPDPVLPGTDDEVFEDTSPSLADQLIAYVGLGGDADTTEETETSTPDATAAEPAENTAVSDSEAESTPVTAPADDSTSTIETPDSQALREDNTSDEPINSEDALVVRHETRSRSLEDLVTDDNHVMARAAAPQPESPTQVTPERSEETAAETSKTAPTRRPWPPKPEYAALIERYLAGQNLLKSALPDTRLSVQLAYLLSPKAEQSLNDLISHPEVQPHAAQIYIFRTRKYGPEALILAFGDFATAEEAEAAIEATPKIMHRTQYQIRSLGKVRADMVLDAL